jgi:hypothetical protein
VFGKSQNGEGVHGETASGGFAAVAGINTGPAGAGNPSGVFGKSQNGEGVHGETASALAAAVVGINLNPDGPAGFFQGFITVTGDINLPGADCAEQFDIAGAAQIEPGTVVVIDREGAVRRSEEAYDKKVAGVVSGAGSHRTGIILDSRQSKDGRASVALMGKVYCKVDAQYSPIELGDLLASSPTPGHAMKADDPVRAFGAVLGKALRPLEAGADLIPILIALQ